MSTFTEEISFTAKDEALLKIKDLKYWLESSDLLYDRLSSELDYWIEKFSE